MVMSRAVRNRHRDRSASARASGANRSSGPGNKVARSTTLPIWQHIWFLNKIDRRHRVLLLR